MSLFTIFVAMNFTFYKYEGTGNDFVLIDNRSKTFPKESRVKISKICDRHFGVGADGLILLEEDDLSDFKMVYYNADGRESSMCGNGGRCIVAFAKKLGIIDNSAVFTAIDGMHEARIEEGIVSLKMIDVEQINIASDHIFLDTGSPHHIEVVDDLTSFPVYERGKDIRNRIYGEDGSNVNFVQALSSDTFRIRTYERGVEDETLACGTGVTAAAIAMHASQVTQSNTIHLKVEGGSLSVSFDTDNDSYRNVILSGPATFVYEGNISI